MGGHAAGTAANAQVGAAQEAQKTVQDAWAADKPGILNAGTMAALGATNAAQAGSAGVLGAGTTAGQWATDAAGTGAAGVTGAAGTAYSALNPYAISGASAADRLASGLAKGGDLSRTFSAADMQANDPGYQFRLAQGQQALQRSLIAAGGGGGGGAMKQLMEYGQNLASSEYGAAFNRFTQGNQNQVANLQNLANAGQAAATTQGNQGLQANEYNAQLAQNAAQFAGNAGMQTNEYAAQLNENAAQYAGNAGMQTNEYAAQLGQNVAQYAGNAQMKAGDARAQGILGKQNAYNGMLSGIGSGIDNFVAGYTDPTGGGIMSGLKRL
jgi:hypothetical protein